MQIKQLHLQLRKLRNCLGEYFSGLYANTMHAFQRQDNNNSKLVWITAHRHNRLVVQQSQPVVDANTRLDQGPGGQSLVPTCTHWLLLL